MQDFLMTYPFYILLTLHTRSKELVNQGDKLYVTRTDVI